MHNFLYMTLHKTGVEAEHVKVGSLFQARSQCQNTKSDNTWTNDCGCSKLTGCRLHKHFAIRSWQTNGTEGFNEVGDVTEITAHIHLPG
jgi:hypothetical protein